MNKLISFRNKGCIDPRCITTIGVSVKEGPNPIGFFGTGLKYAIAIVLRNGGSITIWSGLKELRFTTKPVSIRGEAINVVCMNDQELGFTTHLGKHWEIWQAFREVYCNTVDEGGATSYGEVKPSEDTTIVQVELEGFVRCFAELDKYILQSAPIYQGETAEFHPFPSDSIFYRGIRVGKPPESVFRYSPNIIAQIPLTEDRTLRDYWTFSSNVAKAILTCENKAFLESWLTVGQDYAEYKVDLDWSGIPPSGTFLEVARRLSRDSSRQLNVTVRRLLEKFGAFPDPIPCNLLLNEASSLHRAIEFCLALQYPVNEFPIHVVESLGPAILGQADKQKRMILIARRTIQMGDLTLATTLIEEWAHIKHGVADCSREMQNWLFEQVGRLGAEYLHLIKKDQNEHN